MTLVPVDSTAADRHYAELSLTETLASQTLLLLSMLLAATARMLPIGRMLGVYLSGLPAQLY